MKQLYASVATGTAATLLAFILLVLRAEVQGRRPVVALMRRWISAPASASGFVLALLSAIAIQCFAGIPALQRGAYIGALALTENIPSAPNASNQPNQSVGDAKVWQDLQAYADKIDDRKPSTAASSPAPESVTLPDVDTMIAKLSARLEKQPDDVVGWKLLGWSYLNTGRAADATRAYETAFKLEPGDSEIAKALEAAKSAQTEVIGAPASGPEISLSAGKESAIQDDSMIRGMVDRLATRLESSPNDEDGWLRLMRSRVTLGEKDAAKEALTKALETFSTDPAAKERLNAAARELGVEQN